MASSLSVPSDASPVSSVRRTISPLRFVRGLLGTREENPALASTAGGPDNSLTQAELEVLK